MGFVGIELTIVNDSRTDLDYFSVSLLRTNFDELQNPTLVKVPQNSTGDEIVSAGFFDITLDYIQQDDLYINVTAYDKCGQQSPEPMMFYCKDFQENIPGNTCSYMY